ncbi:MAG TPA: acylphosphatase [Candidatus Dormibacteraeota bacterium]
MAERIRAVVKGRVQGVGFRDFVEREARALNLSGYVRNRPDGTVECVAEGPSDALDRLLDKLRQGPRMSAVGDLEVERGPAQGEFEGFELEW